MSAKKGNKTRKKKQKKKTKNTIAPYKVILIGYMASGKTVVGKRLAKALKLPFIDLDIYLTKKENMSIPEMFKKKGELHFRNKELDYLKKIAKK